MVGCTGGGGHSGGNGNFDWSDLGRLSSQYQQAQNNQGGGHVSSNALNNHMQSSGNKPNTNVVRLASLHPCGC